MGGACGTYVGGGTGLLTGFLWGKLKDTDRLEDLDTDERKIWKWNVDDVD
jgi:hypothetical protein